MLEPEAKGISSNTDSNLILNFYILFIVDFFFFFFLPRFWLFWLLKLFCGFSQRQCWRWRRKPLSPRKAAARAKALKAKTAVLKGIHIHKEKKIQTSPTFQQPKTLRLRRQPKYPRKSTPEETNLTAMPSSRPLTMKGTEDKTTLVFTVDVRADQHQITQVVKKLCDTDMAEVNIPIRTMDRKRHVFDWLLMMMLPTKLGSSRASWWLSWWRTRLPMQEMQKTQVRSLGMEDPLEKEMATCSSTDWKIPWIKGPGGLQSMRLQRGRYDWMYIHTNWVHLANSKYKSFHKIKIYIYIFFVAMPLGLWTVSSLTRDRIPAFSNGGTGPPWNSLDYF